MELEQVHTMSPLADSALDAIVRAVLAGLSPDDPRRPLHRKAALDARVTGPWRPADVWAGALERLVWTASFDTPTGAFFTADAEESLAASRMTALVDRRGAPVLVAEVVAAHLGEGLVVYSSDAARAAYVSVWRERKLRWSLYLEHGVRTVRCDGDPVFVEAPPRDLPEGDRTGVVLAGLRNWLREPLDLDPTDALFVLDRLGELGDGAPVVHVVDERFGAPPSRQRPGVAARRSLG